MRQVHACRTKLRRLKHSLSDDQVASLAAAAHGFVGADLAALCNEAAMAALRRIIAEPGEHQLSVVLRSFYLALLA